MLLLRGKPPATAVSLGANHPPESETSPVRDERG